MTNIQYNIKQLYANLNRFLIFSLKSRMTLQFLSTGGKLSHSLGAAELKGSIFNSLNSLQLEGTWHIGSVFG